METIEVDLRTNRSRPGGRVRDPQRPKMRSPGLLGILEDPGHRLPGPRGRCARKPSGRALARPTRPRDARSRRRPRRTPGKPWAVTSICVRNPGAGMNPVRAERPKAQGGIDSLRTVADAVAGLSGEYIAIADLHAMTGVPRPSPRVAGRQWLLVFRARRTGDRHQPLCPRATQPEHAPPAAAQGRAAETGVRPTTAAITTARRRAQARTLVNNLNSIQGLEGNPVPRRSEAAGRDRLPPGRIRRSQRQQEARPACRPSPIATCPPAVVFRTRNDVCVRPTWRRPRRGVRNRYGRGPTGPRGQAEALWRI